MSGKKLRVVCYSRVATQNQNDDSRRPKVSICVAMLKITV